MGALYDKIKGSTENVRAKGRFDELLRKATPITSTYRQPLDVYKRRADLAENARKGIVPPEKITYEQKPQTNTMPDITGRDLEIREAPRTLGRTLGQFVQNQPILRDIREGLFGTGQSRETLTGERTTPQQQGGAVGFFTDDLFAGETKLVEDNVEILKAMGVEPDQAWEKALYWERTRRQLPTFEEMDEVEITPEERKALQKEDFWENVDIAFAGLDVATGGASKAPRKGAEKALGKVIDITPQPGGKATALSTNLTQQAKKYKSAEEFVKAQIKSGQGKKVMEQYQTVYHGTNRNFTKFDIEKSLQTRNDKLGAGKAIYFTLDKDVATEYSFANALKSFDANVIQEIKDPKARDIAQILYKHGSKDGWDRISKKYTANEINAFDFDVNDVNDVVRYTRGAKHDTKVTGQDEVMSAFMGSSPVNIKAYVPSAKRLGITSIPVEPHVKVAYITPEAKIKDVGFTRNVIDEASKAKKQGYDGIRYSSPEVVDNADEIAIFNPDVIKRDGDIDVRSQLEQIWKEAQTPKPKVATAKQVREQAGKTRLKSEVKDDIVQKRERVGQLETQKMILEEVVDNHPAKEIQARIPAYVRRKYGYGDGSIDLTEVHLRAMKTGSKNSNLDTFVQELGYNNLDEAQEGLEAYVQARQELKQLRQEIRSVRDEIRPLRAEQADLNALDRFVTRGMQGRRTRINAVQDAFNLTDREMAKLRRGRDVRMMNEQEFDDFIRDLEIRGEKEMQLTQGRMEVASTIYEQELKKTENLQKAMNLPALNKMTVEQLKQYNEALSQFNKGDVFLTPRKMEALQNTDLSGVKTYREAEEKLAEKLGVPLSEIQNDTARGYYRVLWDRPLSKQSPILKYWVDQKTKAFFGYKARVYEERRKINELASKARQSRKRSLLDKAIPTDDIVFEYLDTGNKAEIIKRMTPEEVAFAQYVEKSGVQMRDYLIMTGEMDKYRKNYILHMRKDFFENVKDGNAIKAIKSIFEEQKADEAMFNILDNKTGEVLSQTKFFPYVLRRSGGLDPTKNVARAYMRYFDTFQKKVALDGIVSELDVFTDIVSPKAMTPKGLEKQPQLKTFFNQWMNTQKGRFVSFDGWLEQGGIADVALRGIKAFTTLVDLGVNVALAFAQPIGELAGNITSLGYRNVLKGSQRMATKQGQEIAKRYESFVGESFIDDVLQNAEKNIVDKAVSSMMAQYRIITNTMNKQFLLGAMTDDEFAKGVLSAERLAEMRMDMSKWRAVEDSKSVVGSTSLGGGYTQYKTWAFPPLYAWAENVGTLKKMIQTDGLKKAMQSKEAFETYRQISIVAPLLILGAYLKEQDDDSFIGEVQSKMVRDGLSSIGALDPTTWTTARTVDWLDDIANAIMQIVHLEEYKTGEKEGTLKGDDALLRTITPSPIRLLQRQQESNVGTKEDGINLFPSIESSTSDDVVLFPEI